MNYQIYLPAITAPPSPVEDSIDILPHLSGDGRLYELQLIDQHGHQHQARHQTQWLEFNEDEQKFQWRHTKGNEWHAEWEELFADHQFIYRGIDTSPGEGRVYRLEDWDLLGRSRWAPRYWHVGGIYERNPHVDFRDKEDCDYLMEYSGTHRTWLRFAEHLQTITTAAGITIYDVIKLEWLLHNPEEQPDQKPAEEYWFGRNYGLIKWVGGIGRSEVVEVHAPGARPDNKPEHIRCWSIP